MANRRRRFIRRTVFLAVTAAAIVLELWHAFDGDPDTEPWTDLITEYIPGEITATAIGALCAFLVVHFGLRYWRKWRRRRK